MRIDFGKVAVLVLCLTVVVVCSPTVTSREKTYTVQNDEVVDVLSLVFAAEVKANGWANEMVVCFSVNGLDPNPKLVKALRQRNLKVRSSGEWNKKFNCGFELQSELPEVCASKRTNVRTKVVDLRDLNTGQGDIAVLGQSPSMCLYIYTDQSPHRKANHATCSQDFSLRPEAYRKHIHC